MMRKIPTPSLEDAVRRVQEGEASSFESIVRICERPLRAWLAIHAPPGVDVDDLAQRSFVAAYSRLDDFEPGSNFSAWLLTIARFQLKTETTRRRRVADYHARFARDFLAIELERRAGARPDLVTDRLESLRLCVDELSHHLRRFITWRYEEEISLDEMASRSGRSLPAVKKQLFKLRQKLRECVEGRMASQGGGS